MVAKSAEEFCIIQVELDQGVKKPYPSYNFNTRGIFMDVRIYIFALLNLVPVPVCAMEKKLPQNSTSSPQYEESKTQWAFQDRITLKYTDPENSKIQSSIIFFIPTNKPADENAEDRRMPIIGQACCSCKAGEGLTAGQYQAHKEVMITLFKAALAKLAAQKFENVRFTAKLCLSPQCLASYISELNAEDDGLEKIIKTKLP